VNLLRGKTIIVFAILAVAEVVLSAIPGRAQQIVSGEFSLPREVRWGNSDLPEGDYVYFVEADRWPALVRVERKDGGFSGIFVPQIFLRPGNKDTSGIVLGQAGNDAYVKSLYLQGRAGEMNFSAPDAEAEKQPLAGARAPAPDDYSAQTQGYLTIFNPNHEKMPPHAAEKLYLKACEAVEREFNRPAPVRPQLVLRLGQNENVLRYPMREIRLKKWDEYRFADAVVELALHDMDLPGERVKISNSAVRDAAATVNICELKACVN